MSLHNLAQHLQAAGRNEDKVLVHMTPTEVGGLQALALAHGGSLTINPVTGLPEANFLKKLLPTIAGIGLSMIPGVGPLMAAGIVGGGTALATGSLQKGLMAGLGAYGGAGLGAGLSKVGAAAAGAGASGTAGTAGASQLATVAPGVNPVVGQMASGAGSVAPTSLANMQAGLGTLNSMEGFKNLYSALPTGTLPATGATLLAAASRPRLKPVDVNQGMIRPYEFSRTQNQQAYADQGSPMWSENPSSTRERQYFNDQFTALQPYAAPGPEYAADGGLVALADGGPVEQMSMQNNALMLANNPDMPRMAAGGISHLGDYSDGGRLLKGPGDGVSDSIPAVIADRQPARLADGEFVVPARIVSELGNGSTEAGARKLYAMMDRVQGARKKSVGKHKVAVDSKAEKLLPA
jgi:hypothetical protein